MTPFFNPADLRAGDVLLMKGIGPISDLIAWFGDSNYSHAAIMVDREHFVEAAPPVSRVVRLAERLRQVGHYDFIEALRPTRGSGQPLDASQREALAAAARANLEVKYPLDAMVQMAVFAALRQRVPADALLRWLLREIIDHITADDPQHMMCSELVYRALHAAKLAPALVISAQLDLPMPAIDLVELLRAWRQARGKPLALQAVEPAAVSEVELEQSFQRLREHRAVLAGVPKRHADLAGAEVESARLSMPPVLNPKPANVLPVDLETSPQLRRLGRLPLGAL
jgi:CheY-like chemotaxis protein